MEDIIVGALAVAGPFVMIVVALGLVMRNAINRAKTRTELQKEIVGKFSSRKELSEFLATDAGKRLLEDPASFRKSGKVVNLAVAGIIAIGAGAGFYFGKQNQEAGALGIAIGLALLAASAVSYWLAKKLVSSDTAGDSASR